jgi:hypothetical protein
MQSPDPNYRRAAMMALGVSIEGCSEFMTPHMAQVWPVVEAGLQDPEPVVKKAACTTIGCLCEWMEDDCIARHSTLVPVSTPFRIQIHQANRTCRPSYP